MVLEMKMYPDTRRYKFERQDPFKLDGVSEINGSPEHGNGHFSIATFSALGTRIFFARAFEYVKDVRTGKLFVKDGRWCE